MSHEHLKKKALHALFSLRRHTHLIKLKTAFALKVFDAMIPPILTCTGNSESWGVYATPHFKFGDGSQIGKTHPQLSNCY